MQELRHQYDAILVGAGTAAIDDPLLTDRSGHKRRRPLVRVVLDGRLQVSTHSQLVPDCGDAPLIVFVRESADEMRTTRSWKAHGVEVIKTTDRDLRKCCMNSAAFGSECVG